MGFFLIDEDFIVHISNKVKSDFYLQYEGKKLRLPKEEENYPSKAALKEHERTRKEVTMKNENQGNCIK